ncbi:MAG: hypothetical protein GY930_05200 [bacterium]|nr:hypothetical protein [bacterium]
MRVQCFEFRSRLSAALEAHSSDANGSDGYQTQASEVQSLGWHEHLLHCAECCQLLESEQILEELLGTLPEPQLSISQRNSLAQRLAENLRLERWLDLADPFGAAPEGLSDRILMGMRKATAGTDKVSSGLDHRLAELNSVEVPAGLAGRVMRYCREQISDTGPVLTPQKSRAIQRPGRGVPILKHWLTTGLVAASLAAFLWYLPNRDKDNAPIDPNRMVDTNSDFESGEDAEVLALLDSLEVLDLVDELDAEEWELVDQYDSYALFLMDEPDETDGDAR